MGLKSLLNFLPEPIYSHWLRNSLRIQWNLPLDFQFKIAATKEEFQGAFKILHDQYSRSQKNISNPCGLHFDWYHDLPSTNVLVCLHGTEVVGTLTVIRDGASGLPIDDEFDSTHLRMTNRRIAEIRDLAFRSDYKFSQEHIFLPLLKYVYQLCRNYFGISELVFQLNESRIDYYRAVFCVEILAESGLTIAAHLNFEKALVTFQRIYSKKSPAKNLFAYMKYPEPNAFIFPNARYFDAYYEVLNQPLREYFSAYRPNFQIHSTESVIWQNLIQPFEAILNNRRD